MWSFYLAGAAASFRYGSMVNYQLQFAKNRHTLPITRDYMIEGERALREDQAAGSSAHALAISASSMA